MKYTFDEAAYRARDERWQKDPRASDLKPYIEGLPVSVDLVPENPAKLGESRFLRLEVGQTYGKPIRWVNEEKGGGYIYDRAQALAHLRAQSAKPRIEYLTRPPRKHPDALEFGRYFLVSDRMLEVFRTMDPSAIETSEVDFFYLKGQAAPRSHFVIFTRHLMPEDYSRSVVRVELSRGIKSVQCMVPKAFHADIEPEVHVFAADYTARSIYVSRDLVAALVAANLWKVRFLDPAGHYDVVRFEGHDSDWEN